MHPSKEKLPLNYAAACIDLFGGDIPVPNAYLDEPPEYSEREIDEVLSDKDLLATVLQDPDVKVVLEAARYLR